MSSLIKKFPNDHVRIDLSLEAENIQINVYCEIEKKFDKYKKEHHDGLSDEASGLY